MDPSGQVSSDGSCSESLNVELDHGEIAPLINPRPANADYGLNNIDADSHILYIHKGNGYENLIVLGDDNVLYSYPGEHDFATLDPGETVISISSVGNTLVVRTSARMLYALYKDGSYNYLGDRIPEPEIDFVTLNFDYGHLYAATGQELWEGLTQEQRSLLQTASFWQQAYSDRLAGVSNTNTTIAASVENILWGEAASVLKSERRSHMPFFVRYAVRLYDDSVIYTSVPFLMNPSSGLLYFYAGGRFTMYGKFGDAKMQVVGWDTEGWEDIIKSVDIFVSRPLYRPLYNSMIQTCVSASDPLDSYYDTRFEMADDRSLEESLLSATNYYLVKTIKPDEVADYSTFDYIIPEKYLNEDELVIQEVLKEGYRDNHYYMLNGMRNVNGRLLSSGIEYDIALPSYSRPSWVVNSIPELVTHIFELKDDSGISHYVGRDYASVGNTIKWVSYPDTRCIGVYVTFNGTTRYVPMSPHPSLQIAYAVDTYSLGEFGSASHYEEKVAPDWPDRHISEPNLLVQTKSGNPFLVTFDGFGTEEGNVLNVAQITAPLSEGQFGQHSLYIFTDEGIFARAIKADGSLGNLDSVSREICSSPDSILAFEQAVVFVSDRGVNILHGRDVTCISQKMDGPDYDLNDNTLESYLSGAVNYDYATGGNTAFKEFIKECRIIYDAAGRRLILFRTDEKCQYVYKLDTQSWHRMMLDDKYSWIKAMNSYPESKVVLVDDEQKEGVFDFSVSPGSYSGQTVQKGIVVTRELSFESADVYKSIQHMKIRGRYEDGHVKWALQGTNDGRIFHTLHSLRGPSWKWYRIVLLTMLGADERISYVELDYDQKFTNKLR